MIAKPKPRPSMPALRAGLFALLLALATAAPAQDFAAYRGADGVFAQGFDQAVYKGLVGNVLDAIPMNPSKRLDLQRTNAVVGNTLLGRTLTALAGLTNPVLLLGGFVWGVWAASNIRPALAETTVDADPDQAGVDTAAQSNGVALLEVASRAYADGGNGAAEPVKVSAISAEDTDPAAHSRSQVVRIWLPQRSSVQPR